MSSSVPTQLVVLRHKIPDLEHPGWARARHLYGELHGEHILIGADRQILSARLRKLEASPAWIAYATNRKMTFQTRTGWERAFITRVPYMFDCDGHVMPVFDLEKTDLALNYHYFMSVAAAPPPTGPAPLGPAPAPVAPAPAAVRPSEKAPLKSALRRVSFVAPTPTIPPVPLAAPTKRRGRGRSDSTEAVWHGECDI
jgi:hypothetical protein